MKIVTKNRTFDPTARAKALVTKPVEVARAVRDVHRTRREMAQMANWEAVRRAASPKGKTIDGTCTEVIPEDFLDPQAENFVMRPLRQGLEILPPTQEG